MDEVSGGRMRITSVRARFLTASVDDGIAMSFAPMGRRTMALLEVRTDDGLVGYGESWVNYPPWAIAERRATLAEGVAPLLIGDDARHREHIRGKLLTTLEPLGRQWGAPGPIRQAISAADLALWDLAGKASGRSVADLAGGRIRDRIPAYASSLGPRGVEQQAEQCRSLGLRAAKVKVGFGRSVDEPNLRTARKILGDDATLLADANQAWSLDDAVAMATVLHEVGVAWVEEPIQGDRVDHLAELHRRTGLQIATGENVYGPEGFADYAASPEIRVLQPDVSKTGGLTDAITVCQLADQYDKDVAPHLYGGAIAFAATLQLAACSPRVRLLEYDIRTNPLRDPLLTEAPALVDGHVEIPTAPGLGVTVDHDRIADLEVS